MIPTFMPNESWNLLHLEDQKAGGVLMKVANMAVSVGVLASIFYRWTKNQPATASLKSFKDGKPTAPAQKAFPLVEIQIFAGTTLHASRFACANFRDQYS